MPVLNTLGALLRADSPIVAILIIRAIVYAPNETQVCEATAVTEDDVAPDAMYLLPRIGEDHVDKFVRQQHRSLASLHAVLVPVNATQPMMQYARDTRRFMYA